MFGNFGWAQAQAATGTSPVAATPLSQSAQEHARAAQAEREGPPTPMPVEMTYRSMIQFWTWDHNRIQKEIRELKPGDEPIDEGRNYRLEMGITREQYQFILDSILTASSRLGENERQLTVAARQWRAENRGHLSSATPDPELARLERENTALIHSFIDTVKNGLGPDDFAKFDRFVNAHWGGQILAPLKQQTVRP